MAVNGGEQQSIDLRVGRSTVIWFRSSGSRICRGAELGFWEREVGVAAVSPGLQALHTIDMFIF
jgi:hypothetical protein